MIRDTGRLINTQMLVTFIEKHIFTGLVLNVIRSEICQTSEEVLLFKT